MKHCLAPIAMVLSLGACATPPEIVAERAAEPAAGQAPHENEADQAAPPDKTDKAAPPEKADKPLEPDAAAWTNEPKFAPRRGLEKCDVRRHGEQFRIACQKTFGNAADQLAGSPEGVRFGKPGKDSAPAVVFPLRRGEKRVLQYTDFEANRWSWGAFPQLTITAYWLEGDADPTILIH